MLNAKCKIELIIMFIYSKYKRTETFEFSPFVFVKLNEINS